ncbi:DNA-formamidopyrimidine glycosylase [Paenibacillus xylaniclasticus]|uniref:DNA-formamidopyrimidine glycosylase n=1 Tax=Paenibacillus xylaniclasticus TaxID=588083 RepID=UPI000FDBAF81|nr:MULTISPECIES: DNA-formamidopyrimidine glycosylase [Paenibacillus]GFN30122.1 formamidopyrimidine-DNA glycosylase [Paenibacillus curdlanolyticus]
MPELPEVETVCRTLNQLVAGKTIASVSVSLPRIIRRPVEPEMFAAALAGQTIQSVERRGKFIRFVLDGLILVSHLRMEGRYGVYKKDEPVETHTHVVFHFTDDTELRYKDVRQFGTMDLFKPGEEWTMPPLNKLGLEPLDETFTLEAFRHRLAQRSTKLKPLLLDQSYIVGLGNIYVDEALFQAQLHPERTADSLKAAEWKRLYDAIRDTLSRAVQAGGSSIKSYVNGQGEMGMFQHSLLAYGRGGEPCTVCGTLLEKFVLGGRGTHICPKCQPKPRGAAAKKAGRQARPKGVYPKIH